MDTIERHYAPISEHASVNPAIGAPDYKDNAIALRPTAAGTSFPWTMHLLPVERRRALRALYAFCREVDGRGWRGIARVEADPLSELAR